MIRRPVHLGADDLAILTAALAFWHGLLGCAGCLEFLLALAAEWDALDGAEMEAACAHATDLAQRLGAVAGEHGWEGAGAEAAGAEAAP